MRKISYAEVILTNFMLVIIVSIVMQFIFKLEVTGLNLLGVCLLIMSTGWTSVISERYLVQIENTKQELEEVKK